MEVPRGKEVREAEEEAMNAEKDVREVGVEEKGTGDRRVRELEFAVDAPHSYAPERGRRRSS